MFDRYTDRARRVIALAQEHARLLGHPDIDSAHVLLGIAAEGEGAGGRALARFGLDDARVRAAVMRLRPPGASAAPGHLPFTREAKRALELAGRESLQLGHNFIGTEHLLLGLVADAEARPESPVAAVLKACGAPPGEVREAVMVLLRGYGDAPADPAADKAAEGDPLALVLARLAGIARDVGAIRKHLGC